MKIHQNETPLEDRILHVLRNDRERTAQQIADVIGYEQNRGLEVPHQKFKLVMGDEQ